MVAVDAARAFDALLATPRQSIFARGFAAFPPVDDVRDQQGDWDTVGQSRTLLLGDGGSVQETLTSVDRPHSFGYVLDDIHGRLRPFVTSIDGVWSVAQEDGGSRISWAWTMHPAAPPARLTMTVIGRLWQGYADLALKRVEAMLTT